MSGLLAVVVGGVNKVVVKTIVDFSGVLIFRHPSEMGGLTFSVSLIWAQIFPFVALLFYEGNLKDEITIGLVASCSLWVMLNVVKSARST